MATAVTYNGATIATIVEEQVATVKCSGRIMESDIEVVFDSDGEIRYNDEITPTKKGQTANLLCAGKKMLSDIVIKAEYTNLVNTEKAFSVVNNGNISLRDKQTVVFNYVITKDTYFFVPITEPLLEGMPYTVSFDCMGIDDETELRILVDNQTRNLILLENGRMSKTFIPHRTVTNQLLMDDTAPWVNVIGKEIVLSNFKIVEGEHGGEVVT